MWIFGGSDRAQRNQDMWSGDFPFTTFWLKTRNTSLDRREDQAMTVRYGSVPGEFQLCVLGGSNKASVYSDVFCSTNNYVQNTNDSV